MAVMAAEKLKSSLSACLKVRNLTEKICLYASIPRVTKYGFKSNWILNYLKEHGKSSVNDIAHALNHAGGEKNTA